MSNIRFVQFPHPGGEHGSDPDGIGKSWNCVKTSTGRDNPHARTFFQVNGVRLNGRRPVTGPLWAWGEWEAEAGVIRRLDGLERRPATLFDPYWVRRDCFKDLHNTDPFVFGGFFYTDCKQGTSRSLRSMLELDVGSVIIFGSGYAREARWVLDTVFVVGDHIDHNVSNYKDRLRGRIPDGYEQVVLGPTYGEHATRPNLPRRLYIGATYDKPISGMFSFFPCTAPGTVEGFARPQLTVSPTLTKKYFNPNLRQGMKGHGRNCATLSLADVEALWGEVRAQVEAQGCDLGVWAEMPQPRTET